MKAVTHWFRGWTCADRKITNTPLYYVNFNFPRGRFVVRVGRHNAENKLGDSSVIKPIKLLTNR